jgi:hypothetical protein
MKYAVPFEKTETDGEPIPEPRTIAEYIVAA